MPGILARRRTRCKEGWAAYLLFVSADVSMTEVAVKMTKTELKMELAKYSISLQISGQIGPQTCCVVQLASPAGPSRMTPLSKDELVSFTMDGGFAVPVPTGDGCMQMFPVDTPFVSVTVNPEAESMVRELWTLFDQVSVKVHRCVEGDMVRLTGLKPYLAEALAICVASAATTCGASKGVRIFVAVSKTFRHHQLLFEDQPPSDAKYLEITPACEPTVTDFQAGAKLTVPKSEAATLMAALEKKPGVTVTVQK